jgi:hypothetical protein
VPVAFNLCLLLAACQPQRTAKDTTEAEKATLIINNAKVITLNEQNTIAQAVAIKMEKL